MVILKYELKRHRKYILGWAIALALCVFVMTPTYYSFMDVSTGDLYETLGTSDFYKGVGVSMEYLTSPLGIYAFLTSFFMIASGIFGMHFGTLEVVGGEHMVPHVLGVGYAYNEYEVTAGRWKEFEIEFDYADNIKQAAAMLSFKEYICVAICSDVIPQDDLDILRQKRAVPIIVVPPSYSEEQRYACVHFGAAQYLHTYNHPMVEMFSEKNSMRNCLKIPKDKRRPLTIITVKDLSFCLEYRSVEIAGVCIDLTEKEFDILALLIMNQRQVYTYEMIMDSVWHDDFSFYSRNAISSHISNLRKKLKSSETASEHIKSIRGIGYKFEV